jgi:glycosyltransferase involved in cell wall biosynthesis
LSYPTISSGKSEMARIDRRELQLGDRVGEGGIGAVYHVTLRSTAGAQDLMLKEFTEPDRIDADALARLAELSTGFYGADPFPAGTGASWPRHIVVEGERVVGYLMDEAPAEYKIQVRGLGAPREALAAFEFLLTSRSYQRFFLARVVSRRERLELLLRTADLLFFLHQRSIVVGDFSPRNLLFSLDRDPSVFLLDTDTSWFRGRSVLPNVETVGWAVQQILNQVEEPSAATDVFKFALLVLRLLVGDQLAVDPKELDLPRSMAKLASLIGSSLSSEPQSRPDVGAVRAALADALQLERRTSAHMTVITGTSTNVDQAIAGPEPRKLRVLLVGTEWLPRKGGVSQFNRSLGMSLAARGHEVYATVFELTVRDEEDATAHGVRLVVPEIVHGWPSLHVAPADTKGIGIDVVVGHDRFTGLYAATQARQNHIGSTYVVIVHTLPEELEWFKDRLGASGRAERRMGELRSICAEADLICAVGPRLARGVTALMHDGFRTPRVIRLDPGLDFSPTGRPSGRTPGPVLTAIVLGRDDDPGLKGVDLGATAFSVVARAHESPCRLIVRGAAEATADELHRRLCREHGINRGDLVVRAFDPNPGTVAQDLLGASVLLMPSRGEGFGLVGLEAIGVGTPVLVSSRSGLAELLREVAPALAARFIVQIDDDWRSDTDRWSRALQNVFADRRAAFHATLELWDVLSSSLGWDSVAIAVEEAVLDIRA